MYLILKKTDHVRIVGVKAIRLLGYSHVIHAEPLNTKRGVAILFYRNTTYKLLVFIIITVNSHQNSAIKIRQVH